MVYMISSKNPWTNKNFIKCVHCADNPEVAKRFIDSVNAEAERKKAKP